MPDVLSVATLDGTGARVATPVLGEPERYGYQVEVAGAMRCGYSGESFDALYRTDPAGEFTARHKYLKWLPAAPLLEKADTGAHRYLFRIPSEWCGEGRSVVAQVDVDRLVDRYLIAPSQVRASLSGGLTLTVLRTPLAAGIPWPMLLSAAPALAAAGGMGWVLRRRSLLIGLDPELRAALERIDAKCSAAIRAARAHGGSTLPSRFRTLRASAFPLARHIQDLHDRRLLAAASPLADGALQEEDRCRLRLHRLESLFDAALLTLTANPTCALGETLLLSVDAELSAVREVQAMTVR